MWGSAHFLCKGQMIHSSALWVIGLCHNYSSCLCSETAAVQHEMNGCDHIPVRLYCKKQASGCNLLNLDTVYQPHQTGMVRALSTADGDCSHEIKRCLLLGRKVMTNLDSILKSRDITLPTKVHLVKAMVFQWSCMDVRVGL